MCTLNSPKFAKRTVDFNIVVVISIINSIFINLI